METIDMTRGHGKITHVAKSKSILNPPVSQKKKTVAENLSAVSFLKEITISGLIPACYFTSGATFPNETGYFEIGTLKLPAGFQYVDYLKGTPKPNWDNKGDKRENDIFTTILIKLNTQSQPHSSFHLCEEDPSGLFGGSMAGCSWLVRPYNDNNFILFYYDEVLYFSDGSGLNGKPADIEGYYLIPMTLSERIVVYYVIEHKKNDNTHIELLNEIKENFDTNPQRRNCIAINENLQLNDKLGIFVTRDITPKDPKPATDK